MSTNTRRLFTAGIVAILFLAGCKKTAPANVAAQVNGRSITFADLDKQYQAQFGSVDGRASDDQMVIQKLELLRGMIDGEIMLQRAEKLGLMATDTDVEAKLTELKAPYTQEEFQKLLLSRKMSLDDLKTQVRRDLSVNKLFNKEFTSHIQISDRDIADFYNANKSNFSWAEPHVHLMQIVVSPNPDPNVRNLKGDKAQTEEQAKKKVEMLLGRLRQSDDFSMLAQNYSEDASTAPNGGDMGFIPQSALEKANPELRKMVMDLQPGQYKAIHTQDGYRILRLISREAAGQRELSDPRVQQTIRETLMNRKDQLYRAAYYEVARNEAQVANYLSRQVLQERDQKK
ncbi:MAG: SurA N-terminal domain-containing protein [Acidobacteria bacterium]|nr:SurA N-terminal domain-containing protein [Acidobacteriota bacterium]